MARPEDYRNEIDFIQDVVSQHFPVYKTEVEFDIVSVYVKTRVDETLEDEFDELRKKLVPQNFVPYLVEENGEHVIKVKMQEDKSFRGVKANIVMLFITLGTTLIAGAWWWSSYAPAGGGMLTLHNLSRGALFFTLPLMTILGTHEMGHYLMARYHGIKASLPFFLPMAPPLGTIGAFISIREPIPDKKSLLDVGIAGPIAGFVVAVPVSIMGLYLAATTTPTAPIPEEGLRYMWNFPVIMRGLSRLIPLPQTETIHPTLFAGWVGFLVTGLNLIPASQLDGGHVVRSLFGDKSKYVSYIAFAFFIIVGITLYLGWLVFGVLILFLGGVKHPPPLNDITKLDKKRLIVGGVAILILFVSFHPVPVDQERFSYGYEVRLEDEPEQQLMLDESYNYTITVENQAKNVDVGDGIDYEVNYSLSDQAWNSELYECAGEENDEEQWIAVGNETDLKLDIDENRTYRLYISPTANSSMRNEITFEVTTEVTESTLIEKVDMVSKIGNGFDAEPSDQYSLVEEGTAAFDFSLLNRGRNDSYEVKAKEISGENWTVDFLSGEDEKENLTLDHIGLAQEEEFTAVLSENDTHEPEGNLTVVTFKVIIESQNTSEKQEFELAGIKINE
ncbi:MAG: site-2 protease family protein [Candidatus Thermoplasmatota archaeon]